MARLRPPMPAESEAAPERPGIDVGAERAPAIEGSVAESFEGATVDPAAGDDPAFVERRGTGESAR
jgi:hypothetical protein